MGNFFRVYLPPLRLEDDTMHENRVDVAQHTVLQPQAMASYLYGGA